VTTAGAAGGYGIAMLALLLVAASVGLSNFAAAISLGVSGVDARTRLRVGLIFGAFEAGMPVVGLFIGANVAAQLGHASRWIGGALLICVGLYALASSIRAHRTARAADPARSTHPAHPAHPARPGGSLGSTPQLLLSGLALSLDNLVVGFALGTYQVSILVSALVIGGVSVGLSLVGLELGARLGGWAGERGDQLGGLILISVGAAVAVGALQ
jgi:manganese efflux pump family protein